MNDITANPDCGHWRLEGTFASLVSAYARRVTEHPAKLRIVRWLAGLLRTNVRHPGGGRLRFVSDDYIAWSLLMTGSFERHSLALAIELMRGGGVFLDVGANMGLYSLAVSAATACRSVAVEPEPTNFARLQDNLTLNPGLDIALVNCAATPEPAWVDLEVAPAGGHAWTRIGRPGAPNSVRVRGLPLELILRDAGVAAVALLKIDVEGYEPEALRGLDWHGPHRPRHVLMECSPGDTQKLKLMAEHNYDGRTIHGAPLHGLTEYPEGNVHFTSRS